MDFVIRDRCGGKTTEALKWLKENPGAVLLVHDESYAVRLRRDHGLTGQQVMPYQAAGRRLLGRHPLVVGVDNLDIMLRSLLGLSPDARVELVTATGQSR